MMPKVRVGTTASIARRPSVCFITFISETFSSFPRSIEDTMGTGPVWTGPMFRSVPSSAVMAGYLQCAN